MMFATLTRITQNEPFVFLAFRGVAMDEKIVIAFFLTAFDKQIIIRNPRFPKEEARGVITLISSGGQDILSFEIWYHNDILSAQFPRNNPYDGSHLGSFLNETGTDHKTRKTLSVRDVGAIRCSITVITNEGLDTLFCFACYPFTI